MRDDAATLGSITRLAPTVTRALGLRSPHAAKDEPLSMLVPRMAGSSHVLVMVLDSWGELNWQRHRARTPYLDEIDGRFRVGTLAACQPSTTPSW